MTEMAVQRLSHISLHVADIDRSVDFYRSLLDGQVAFSFINDAGERYGVFLHCGNNSFIELFRYRDPIVPGSGFRHFCLEVDDISAMANHVRALGFEAVPSRGRRDGTLRLEVTDPDGYVVEFHQLDEGSALYSWIAGQQVITTTSG